MTDTRNPKPLDQSVTRYLTRVEAADFMRLSPYTLANWARLGRGPRFVHAGRRTLYRVEDLEAFLAAEGEAA